MISDTLYRVNRKVLDKRENHRKRMQFFEEIRVQSMRRFLRPIKRLFFRAQNPLEKEIARLAQTPPAPCKTEALAYVQDFDHSTCFAGAEDTWQAASSTISKIMPHVSLAEGINPGDRRAVYTLVRYLRPQSILEIGTNVGASTLHMAIALHQLKQENPEGNYHLTTVDIVDVNDPRSGPWQAQGLSAPPQALMHSIGLDQYVTFVTQKSLTFMQACAQKFDFVFLDGDHSARAVYQETAAACQILNPYGYILLHDYFPQLQPLWSEGEVFCGPWLAVQRHQKEGAGIEVLPVGELPWSTKFNSNVTSLALLGKAR